MLSSLQQQKFDYLADWLTTQSGSQTQVLRNGEGPRIIETVEIDAQTRVELETFAVSYQRLYTRHYILQRDRLPEGKEQRYCVILHILGLTNPDSYMIYAVDDNGIYVFHHTKCDQPNEALLDDYYRVRNVVTHLIVQLPRILEDAMTACQSETAQT
ncbi:MAG: hypothetical protein SF162_10275 [bacterium]|nr:hypothetical protein [bacterium]